MKLIVSKVFQCSIQNKCLCSLWRIPFSDFDRGSLFQLVSSFQIVLFEAFFLLCFFMNEFSLFIKKKMLIRIQATCFFALCCETWFQQYNCLSKLIIGVYVCVFSDLYILKKKRRCIQYGCGDIVDLTFDIPLRMIEIIL